MKKRNVNKALTRTIRVFVISLLDTAEKEITTFRITATIWSDSETSEVLLVTINISEQ